jgi:hypothetical protein
LCYGKKHQERREAQGDFGVGRKRELEKLTSGEEHYLTFEVHQETCKQNHVETREIPVLLRRCW